jgi:hypothetical protein
MRKHRPFFLTKIGILLFVVFELFSPHRAHAQFAPGQTLSANALNAALARPTIVGGSVDGTPIGSVSPSTGHFTTLFSTTATAATSVVTPQLSSPSGSLTLIPGTAASGVTVGTPATAATIGLRIAGGSNELAQVGPLNTTGLNSFSVGWAAISGTGGGFFLSSATSAILDSGSAGSLSLRTNNGTPQVIVNDSGSADRPLNISAGLTSSRSLLTSVGSLVNWSFITNGGAFNFYSGGGETTQQFQIFPAVSANRFIVVTGSNGGNPVMSTSGGDLNLTANGTQVTITGGRHLTISGTVPTMGACGTSPSVVGNDGAMLITVGTGGTATSCAVTFNTAYVTNPPICIAQNNTDKVAYSMVTTTTTLTISAAAAFTASSKFHVHCTGWL